MKLCVITLPTMAQKIERMTPEGNWEPDDGTTPSLAFSGRDNRTFPRAWFLRDSPEDVKVKATSHTTDRFNCSNGCYDVTPKGRIRKPKWIIS